MPGLSPALTLSAQDPLSLSLLVLAGAFASAINAVAGGGSLLSFPLLVALGVPALAANATNSAALAVGNGAGALGFLDQLRPVRRHLVPLLMPAALGSIAGAWLLTHTSERLFRWVVPLLIGLATILLALQPRIRRWVEQRVARPPLRLALLLQLAVSVYGGYFGAGMGILMLAALGLAVAGTLHELNALKNWLSVAINLVAAAVLLWRGLVWLWPALALGAGAILGGYAAARWSQRVPAHRLRQGIVVLGVVLSVWFAWRAFRA